MVIIRLIILLAHIVCLSAMAIIAVVYPELIVQNFSGDILALLRIIGFVYMTMALVSFFISRKPSYSSRVGLLTVSIFHWGGIIANGINIYEGVIGGKFILIHIVFAFLFTILATKECKDYTCKI